MSELITWLVMLGPLAVGLIWGLRIHNQLVRRRNFVDDAWSGIEVQLKRRQNVIPALWRTVHSGADRSIEADLPDLDHRLSPSEATAAVLQQDAILEKMADSPAPASVALAELRETLAGIESDIEHSRRYFNGTAREYNTLVESFPSSLIAGMFNFSPAEYFQAGHGPGANPG